MAALARIISRVSGWNVDVETLKTIVLFCGIGLFGSLVAITCGIDLGAILN